MEKKNICPRLLDTNMTGYFLVFSAIACYNGITAYHFSVQKVGCIRKTSMGYYYTGAVKTKDVIFKRTN
jgi:hypothetical protein